MEERKRKTRIGSDHLTELEKDVLDEFILDIKNMKAVIPLHEENSRAKYEKEHGKGASLALLKVHLDYVVINGEFSKEQSLILSDLLSRTRD